VIVALLGRAGSRGPWTGFVFYELRIAAAPMADLRLFARRSFAATGFVAFAISATVHRADHLPVAVSAEHPRLLPGPGRAAVPAADPGLLHGSPC